VTDFAAEGYFVITPEWVLDADISDKAVRLYGVLRSYADHRTGLAFPSRRTLAARLHVADPKAVDRAMAELEVIGAVTVERSAPAVSGQARSSNRYLLRHTPPGKSATPPNPSEWEMTSSGGSGKNATTGGYATGVGAETPPERLRAGGVVAPAPLGSGASATRGSGASAPLTRPIELNPENQRTPLPPAAAGEDGQLALVPSSEEGQQRRKVRPSGDAAFDAFYDAYPKRMGRADALRAWGKAVKRADADKIIAAVRAYPFDLSRPKFIPLPATWLNGCRWEDDPEAVAAANQPPRTASGRLAWTPPPRGSYDAGDGTF